MSQGDTNREKTSKADFNRVLIESVHEAFDAALGQTLSEILTLHLQRYLGISNDELPSHIESLFSALRDSFGLSGDILGKVVVKRISKKARIPFYEVGDRPMIEYVQELKRKLADVE